MTHCKTFLKITNQDIYKKLNSIDQKTERIEQHILETNGKVKLNRWIATTALTLSTTVVITLLIVIVRGQ